MLSWFFIEISQNNAINKFCKFVIILLATFLCVTNVLAVTETGDHHHHHAGEIEKLPFCGGENQRDLSRRLLFVTTLDGKLSALDMSDNGVLKWSIATKPDYLLSSSIHRLELTNNGQLVRMIPSLSGGLYKFDGGTIEPIPVTAERLLSASFKFSDDLVISGGKETRSYGISSKNGKILYECSIHGCQNTTDGDPTTDKQSSYEIHNDNDTTTTDHDPLLDEIIIVRRQTQTVRAVESRTGGERWNFSVGHHELEVLKPDNCHERPFSELDNSILDLQLKVIVPEGIVCAVRKTNPSVILWKYKFDHPIVSAWKTASNDNLEMVDLFSYLHWPWPSTDDMPNNYRDLSPSLYVGMFNRQLYIQESEHLRKIIHSSIMSTTIDPLIIDHVRSKYLRIPWKPIAVGGSALNLIANDKLIEDENEQNDGKLSGDRGGDISSITALSVLHASEYANGNGFYLYSPIDLIDGHNQSEHQCNMDNGTTAGGNTSSSSSYDNDTDDYMADGAETRVQYIIFSFWYSWKQILIISLATAVCMNFLLFRRLPNDHREVVIVERHVEVQVPVILPANPTDDLLRERSTSESSTTQFTSRFSTDFQTIQCLGKGGFGVVFEAKNKLDDCNYAIKRIVLPNRQESRDRVMREVKTLAHCEHQHIVRYFQAWVETPPPGWQEKEDKHWLDRNAFSHSIDIESPTPTTPTAAPPIFAAQPKIRSELINKKHNDLNKWILTLNTNECLNFDDNNYKTTFVNEKMSNGSDNFLKQFKIDGDSFDNSLSKRKDSAIVDDDSFEIEFKDNSTIDENSNNMEADSDIGESNKNSMKNGKINSDISTTNDSFMIEFKEPSFSSKHPQLRTNNGGQRRQRIFSYTCGDTTSDRCCDDDDNVDDNKIPEDKASTNNNKLVPFKKTHRRPLSLDLSSKETRANFFAGNQRMYLYIQMQLCKKQSLKDWLKLNKLDTRQTEIVPIFRQIVDAVEYVHLKGLIHRDLKPSNIFFSLDGQIKIGDFGLVTDMTPDTSPLVNGNDINGDDSSNRHSKHTERVGTHLYMSPEQLDGKHYNYKVDIYSLGFILFELLVVFGTEMERIETLKSLRQHKFPNGFSSCFTDEYKLLKLMLSQMPNERPTTIGIRSRPPLNQTDIVAQSLQWHFELPPRRRESTASINCSNSTSTAGGSSGCGGSCSKN